VRGREYEEKVGWKWEKGQRLKGEGQVVEKGRVVREGEREGEVRKAREEWAERSERVGRGWKREKVGARRRGGEKVEAF
jgi:hypothetical protein